MGQIIASSDLIQLKSYGKFKCFRWGCGDNIIEDFSCQSLNNKKKNLFVKLVKILLLSDMSVFCRSSVFIMRTVHTKVQITLPL